MNKKIRKVLKPFVPKSIWKALERKQAMILLKKWNNNGCPIPPPHIVKQITIGEYQDKYNYSVFVETGTYLGDMVEAQKKRFKKLYSIELGVDLFNEATRRFKRDENVTILQGDSGIVLSKIMSEISEPAIFQLDGHYSSGITAKGDKDCPIVEELNAIFENKGYNHVLLIDDARCFTGDGDYPTIDRLTEYIKSKNDNYQVEVKNDIIRYSI